MSFVRLTGMLGFVAAALLVADVGGQGVRPKRAEAGSGPLIAPDALAKLKLSAEQADKVKGLEKELADKSRDIETRAKELMERARQEKDRAGFKKANEILEDGRKL